MIQDIKTYTAEVSKEMKKVAWPTQEQLKESTTVVVAVCGIITLFVFAVDELMTLVVKYLL